MTVDASATPGVDYLAETKRILAEAVRARQGHERRLAEAPERYRRDPLFRARVYATANALHASRHLPHERGVESRTTAHELAILAVVRLEELGLAPGEVTACSPHSTVCSTHSTS